MPITEKRHCVSAGGILFRNRDGSVDIVVVKRHRNVESKWAPVLCQLPKGELHANEDLENGALREVLEETGYEAEIRGPAGVASWSYQRAGIDWTETVHYFLMTTLSSVPHCHDDEFDEVCWLSLDEAVRALSYPEERRLLVSLQRDAFGHS